MTRPIPYRTRRRILELFLRGESLNGISRKTKVSKGAVVSIAKEIKEGSFPKIQATEELFDELRFVSAKLRKIGWTIEQAVLGIVLLEWLGTLNVGPERIRDWVGICKDLESPDFPSEEFAATAVEIRKEEMKRGKGFQEIYEDFRRMEKKAEKADKRAAEAERILRELKERVSSRRAELALIEDVESLKSTKETLLREEGEARSRRDLALKQTKITERMLRDFGSFQSSVNAAGHRLTSKVLRRTAVLVAERPEEELSQLLELHVRLRESGEDFSSSLRNLRIAEEMEEAGFNLRYWTLLRNALKKRKMTPDRAFDELADAIRQYVTLKEAIMDKHRTVSRIQRTIDEKKNTLRKLEKHQKEATERLAEVRSEAEKVNDLNKELLSEIGEHCKERDELLGIKKALASEVVMVQRNLAEALEVNCRWEDVETALEEKRGEIGKLQEKVEAMGDKFEALDWLESALRGDQTSARLFFTYLASEPYSMMSLGIPSPEPDEARKRLVEWVLQLLEPDVVSRTELEAMKEDFRRKLGSIEQEQRTETTVVVEKERARVTDLKEDLKRKDKYIKELKTDIETLRGEAEEGTNAIRYALHLKSQLNDLRRLLPSVKGQRYETAEEFHDVVSKVFTSSIERKTKRLYGEWLNEAVKSGKIVVVGTYFRTIACSRGHQWQLQVNPEYVANALSGRRSGALLPRFQHPGSIVECCPICGDLVDLELKDLL